MRQTNKATRPREKIFFLFLPSFLFFPVLLESFTNSGEKKDGEKQTNCCVGAVAGALAAEDGVVAKEDHLSGAAAGVQQCQKPPIITTTAGLDHEKKDGGPSGAAAAPAPGFLAAPGQAQWNPNAGVQQEKRMQGPERPGGSAAGGVLARKAARSWPETPAGSRPWRWALRLPVWEAVGLACCGVGPDWAAVARLCSVQRAQSRGSNGGGRRVSPRGRDRRVPGRKKAKPAYVSGGGGGVQGRRSSVAAAYIQRHIQQAHPAGTSRNSARANRSLGTEIGIQIHFANSRGR